MSGCPRAMQNVYRSTWQPQQHRGIHKVCCQPSGSKWLFGATEATFFSFFAFSGHADPCDLPYNLRKVLFCRVAFLHTWCWCQFFSAVEREQDDMSGWGKHSNKSLVRHGTIARIMTAGRVLVLCSELALERSERLDFQPRSGGLQEEFFQ